MRMISFRAPLPALALLLFFLVAFVHADIDTKFERFFRDRHDSNHGGSTVTKEDIKANMERRKVHLQKMLADSQDKVERHLAGEQVLEGDETHEMLVKRMDAIRRKLERMEAVDDQELDRMHHRETRRWEQRRSRSREL